MSFKWYEGNISNVPGLCLEIMLEYLSADIICSKKQTVELWGTDNVEGQISEHIFAPNQG